MARTMTGGCQCGRVRYTAEAADDAAYLCHCGMCRRATGGVAAALKQFAAAAIAWQGEPVWYRSSPIAERPFCASCGTPLGFRYVGSEKLDLTIGSFDDPGFFRPTEHFSTETMLAAWADTGHLPGRRLDEYRPLVDRWTQAIGAFPA